MRDTPIPRAGRTVRVVEPSEIHEVVTDGGSRRPTADDGRDDESGPWLFLALALALLFAVGLGVGIGAGVCV